MSMIQGNRKTFTEQTIWFFRQPDLVKRQKIGSLHAVSTAMYPHGMARRVHEPGWPCIRRARRARDSTSPVPGRVRRRHRVRRDGDRVPIHTRGAAVLRNGTDGCARLRRDPAHRFKGPGTDRPADRRLGVRLGMEGPPTMPTTSVSLDASDPLVAIVSILLTHLISGWLKTKPGKLPRRIRRLTPLVAVLVVVGLRSVASALDGSQDAFTASALLRAFGSGAVAVLVYSQAREIQKEVDPKGETPELEKRG